MRLTPAQTRETWLAARALRNRMLHEYIRNPVLLSHAVTEAHDCVPMLVRFVQLAGLARLRVAWFDKCVSWPKTAPPR